MFDARVSTFRKRVPEKVLGCLIVSSACIGLLGARVSYSAEKPAFPLPGHVDQLTISQRPFPEVFRDGDGLFTTSYNSLDGVGANLSGDAAVSTRFTRVPRVDLPGYQANPFRVTGPNARSCAACHDDPLEAAAGGIEASGLRDPHRTGNPALFIQRNPIHLFGSGALQRLAEEATAELKAIRGSAVADAQRSGAPVTARLVTSNGVDYGSITAAPSGSVDASGVRGVDPDLVVKPFLWKGELASFLRAFVRGSADIELGMQPAELFGPDVDADGDGVSNELSAGDITAMTIYVAAQPRPVTRLELSDRLGGAFKLTPAEVASITRGAATFETSGCAVCHRPVMELKSAVFQEPSSSPDYRDPFLPIGVDPRAIGIDPSAPVAFDLTVNPTVREEKHGPACDGRLHAAAATAAASGSAGGRACFPQFESNGSGGALVHLYGDLKRHDMGPGLAEAVDEIGTGRSIWLTAELWGVGSTGPWLHDGRATTLSEAILFHGGEAQESRDRFAALGEAEREDLVNFLKNLVLFRPERGDRR